MNVAGNREPGQTIKQIASDFGIAESCLRNWMRQADVEAGARPGTTAAENAELREAKKRIRLFEQENEVLRRAAADLTAAHRANALFDAHRDDPEFGYRYLHEEAAEAGQVLAGRAAWSICSQQGWWSAFGKKRAKNGKRPGPPVHEDLCAVVDEHSRTRHVFTADAPNQLWLTDITEHRPAEGTLYLCAVKDVYSNRIVGYSIDSRMKSRLAVAALNSAVARRGDVTDCVLHTDQGSQFRSRKHVHALGCHSMVGSMGRVGAAGDNAAMESFFALLQNNVLDRRPWATRQELRIAIVTWIERTYHHRRRQAALSRSTPIEYETITTTVAAQAA